MSIKNKLIKDKSIKLSLKTKCEILALNRSSYYYKSKPSFSEEDIKFFYKMTSIFERCPFYGYRRLHQELLFYGFKIGKEKTRQSMKFLGLKAKYPKKVTTIANKEHRKYPYLLKDLEVNRINQVWSTDITYIWHGKGFYYLVAIIDWYSKKILSFRLSNTMDTSFCIEALEEALAKYPKPEIFNTDQGSQFTSNEFTGILQANEISISMDGKGRATDNIAIERFWRTIKYENILLNEYFSGLELKQGITDYMEFYNESRIHSTLGYKTPSEVYHNRPRKEANLKNDLNLMDFDLFRNLILKKVA